LKSTGAIAANAAASEVATAASAQPAAALAFTHAILRTALAGAVLSAGGYERLLSISAAEGISGGAVYDAVVAATALEAGATLLTFDRRAVAVYQLLRTDYKILG
jgi:predicted nucleic acid-binding protein